MTFKAGQTVMCVNGREAGHKIRAGKTYTVARYRTAAEAMGISVVAQVWLVDGTKWWEADRFEALPPVYMVPAQDMEP